MKKTGQYLSKMPFLIDNFLMHILSLILVFSILSLLHRVSNMFYIFFCSFEVCFRIPNAVVFLSFAFSASILHENIYLIFFLLLSRNYGYFSLLKAQNINLYHFVFLFLLMLIINTAFIFELNVLCSQYYFSLKQFFLHFN